MRIFIATDFRVFKEKNRIYISNKASQIIERYFRNFGEVVLCTRTVDSKPDGEWKDMTACLYKFIGVSSLLDIFSVSFSKRMRKEIMECDLVVGRLESFVALKAFDIAQKCKKPYLSEVMSDAWDGLWNHSFLGKIVAPYSYIKTKKVVKNSGYALYVTKQFLQSRYPCSGLTTNVSNVLLPPTDPDVLNKRLKKIQEMDTRRITIMTTAAVYVKYKGQQFVIQAIPPLNKQGIRVRYLIVGEGDQSYLRSVAKKYNVEDQVEFMGRLPLNGVFSCLDECDIYIQPSLQEGLPRSVIEAMSRGCPCLGSKTAGIPELIDGRYIFKRKSVEDIVRKILLIVSRDNMTNAAVNNFEESKLFSEVNLNQRRTDFYNMIKNEIIETTDGTSND